MIAEPQEEGLFSSDQVREYIGSMFREKVRNFLPSWYSNQGMKTTWMIVFSSFISI